MSADIIDLKEHKRRNDLEVAADVAWAEFVAALTFAQAMPTLENMRVAVRASDAMLQAIDRAVQSRCRS